MIRYNGIQVSEILPGVHVSPETAYIVNDYPYGFRLRCKIRYWLEGDAKKGWRFCSQTTNPKIANAEVWNKPKKGTYHAIAAVLFKNELGHVHATGLSYYQDSKELAAFQEVFQAGFCPEIAKNVDQWLALKRTFESEMARGEFEMAGCSAVARLVGARKTNGELITLEEAQSRVRSSDNFAKKAPAPSIA